MRQTASASPRASTAVVEAVGASPCGQASRGTPELRVTSASRPSVESSRPVMAMRLAPSDFRAGRMAFNSAVSPELEMAMITSSRRRLPRSPCAPSTGCRKKAGVPVEEKVAASLRPTSPDLPMPVTTTRPAQAASSRRARTRGVFSGVGEARRSRTAASPAISVASTSCASATSAAGAVGMGESVMGKHPCGGPCAAVKKRKSGNGKRRD